MELGRLKPVLPALIAVALLIVINLLYLFNFGPGISKDPGAWGQYGDFIGGVLNPIAALASVYFLYITLARQMDDSEEQAKLARTNLELAMQNMQTQQEQLNLASSNLEISMRSINVQQQQIEISARQLRDGQAYRLIDLYREMSDRFTTAGGDRSGAAAFKYLRECAIDEMREFLARGQAAVPEHLHAAYANAAERYFSAEQRHIKQFVLSTTLTLSLLRDMDELNEQKTYIDILKSQMTQDELFALVFWYISPHSDADFRSMFRHSNLAEHHISDIPRTNAVDLVRRADHRREMAQRPI